MPYKDVAKRRECSRRHYRRNKAAYKARAKRYTALQRKKLSAIVADLKSKPCADCGRSFPSVCMDFDHKDPGTKEANIADAVDSAWSIAHLLKEIEKCDVVCSNCYRIRTRLL
jgi:hypothetical protein